MAVTVVKVVNFNPRINSNYLNRMSLRFMTQQVQVLAILTSLGFTFLNALKNNKRPSQPKVKKNIFHLSQYKHAQIQELYTRR